MPRPRVRIVVLLVPVAPVETSDYVTEYWIGLGQPRLKRAPEPDLSRGDRLLLFGILSMKTAPAPVGILSRRKAGVVLRGSSLLDQPLKFPCCRVEQSATEQEAGQRVELVA